MINHRYAKGAALALIALGLLVLLGWHYDITAFKTVLPGLNSMKANTAVAFVLLGAVVLSLTQTPPHPTFARASRAFTMFVALIGALSAVAYLADVDLGINELLFIDDTPRQANMVPGQMSIVTALMLTLAGALGWIARSTHKVAERGFVIGTTLGLIVSFILLLVYVYGEPEFLLEIRASTVAIHTAAGLLLLFSGLAATRPDLGLVARLSANTAGGKFVRRMAPAILLGVPAVGWLCLQGELAGYYDSRVGLALFASANIVLLMAVIWGAGHNADQADNRRLQDKVKQQKALAAFSAEALVAPTVAELYKLAITAACSVMRATFGSLVDVDEKTGHMQGLNVYDATDTRPFSRNISVYPPSSVLHYALRAKEMFWYGDAAQETRFTFNDQIMSGLQSGVTVPVASTDGTARLLSIFYANKHQFNSDELEFLQSLANTLAVAYERRRTADDLNTRMAQRNALATLSEQALTYTTVAELSHATITAAFTSLHADYGSLTELDEASDAFTLISLTKGADIRSSVHKFSAYPATAVFAYAMKSDEPFAFSDIDNETRFVFVNPVMKRFKSGLVVPVAGNDGRKRRLSVYRDDPHVFTADEIEFLLAAASVTATAHERIRAVDALKAQNAALEKADRAKSQFLAMMSHELRTPMAGLLGMADLLMLTPLTAEQQQMTSRLIRSGKSLLDILNDILDFSKLDADKMVLETVPFSLSRMLSDLQNLFAPIAKEKNLDLAIKLPETYRDAVVGDTKRIRQVVTNLLSNAFKFTSKGQVLIGVEQTESIDGALLTRISVTDTGIGVDKEQVQQLFKPFVQADASTSRKYGGTGLGLSICHRLVTMMGGEITVSSQPGEGSTFAFTMLLQPDLGANGSAPTTKVLRKPEAVVAEARPRRILLAEDNDTNRLLITAMLEKKGHTVVAVENGQLAIEAVAHTAFDIALMDMQMPVLDGPAAMRHIRSTEKAGSRLPIIALTADVTVEHGEQYLAAGADTIVSKPVNWPALFAEIERLHTAR